MASEPPPVSDTTRKNLHAALDKVLDAARQHLLQEEQEDQNTIAAIIRWECIAYPLLEVNKDGQHKSD